jgi:hypothetical protein
MTDSPDTAASSIITSHAFIADLWWDSCAVCGLSMAAHHYVTPEVLGSRDEDLKHLPYRCPQCVWATEFNKPAPHGGDCPHENN